MLNWALIFLIVTILAGILGFSGIAGALSWLAQALFIVFLTLSVFNLFFKAMNH